MSGGPVNNSKRESVAPGFDNSEGLTPVYIVVLLICVVLVLENVFLKRWYQNGDELLPSADSAIYSVVYEGRIRQLMADVLPAGNRNVSSTSRRRCRPIPEKLLSRDSTVNNSLATSLDALSKQNPDVKPGGVWLPSNCVPRHNVAIVIPYRNRRQHFLKLLPILISVLKAQEVSFRIYLSEQNGTDTFNKGVLMNAAYVEALKDRTWDCFVFHDVDIILENIRTMYTCPTSPRHLSVAIDEYDYKLPYDFLVGGVFIIRREHFLAVNGYSNRYWGWGSEDDDMSRRIQNAGFRIDRPPYNVARFTQIKHEKREAAQWKIRYKQLYSAESRQHSDGVRDVTYTLVSRRDEPLFTHFIVDVGTPPQ